MLLDFDLNKSIAATAYLIEKEGGSDSMFFIIKKLYYADRSALIEWGMSITGDELVSMRSGPVVGGIYDLFKGKGLEKHLAKWNEVIDRKGNTIRLRKSINPEALSEREIALLEKSRLTINKLSQRGYSVAHWLHKNCPEWENPHGSSTPIDPSTILRKSGKTEQQIVETEKANEEIRFINQILGPR